MPAPTVRPPSRIANASAPRDPPGDELDGHLDVVTGITILVPSGSWQVPSRRRAHVELRTVVGEERRVTAPLSFFQDVHLALESCAASPSPACRESAPRSTSSSRCAEKNADLSPAWPWSRSLRDISTPVTTVLRVSRKPMNPRPLRPSSPPHAPRDRHHRPATLIENTSSIAIRNRLSMSRTGSGISGPAPRSAP